ncbi:phytohormone-binding protein [Quercus suber]|uniref:Phytohormone-binding protein n=1 Tax=Quercus suber TaxID=58331 RepID=A0AAW0LV37_QUESU|nr:phytohormone-binding protein [Quercus suber]
MEVLYLISHTGSTFLFDNLAFKKRAMIEEVKAQAKVGVGLNALWKALTKELRFVVPKVLPNIVKDVELIEGDGGLGTLLLFNFFSGDVSVAVCQKEEIVELEESLHRIALQVLEGGHLNKGFSFYKTTFQLNAIAKQETLVDVTVSSETETDQESTMPSKTIEATLEFLKCLETYIMNGAS